MNIEKYAGQCVALALEGNIIKATKYISDQFTVKATEKRFKGKKVTGRRTEVVVTVGKPNYAERKFIKKLKEAGEKFPVKKIQLRIGSN